MRDIRQVGLFVTSNESLSHLLFNDADTTPCGLKHRLLNTKHPASDVRWIMPIAQFRKWIVEQRKSSEPGYRMCKRCLKAYDLIPNGLAIEKQP